MRKIEDRREEKRRGKRGREREPALPELASTLIQIENKGFFSFSFSFSMNVLISSMMVSVSTIMCKTRPGKYG